jgi:hypothetical protein
MTDERGTRAIALAIRDDILRQVQGKMEVVDGDLLLWCSDSNAMIDCMEVAQAVAPLPPPPTPKEKA